MQVSVSKGVLVVSGKLMVCLAVVGILVGAVLASRTWSNPPSRFPVAPTSSLRVSQEPPVIKFVTPTSTPSVNPQVLVPQNQGLSSEKIRIPNGTFWESPDRHFIIFVDDKSRKEELQVGINVPTLHRFLEVLDGEIKDRVIMSVIEEDQTYYYDAGVPATAMMPMGSKDRVSVGFFQTLCIVGETHHTAEECYGIALAGVCTLNNRKVPYSVYQSVMDQVGPLYPAVSEEEYLRLKEQLHTFPLPAIPFVNGTEYKPVGFDIKIVLD